MEYWLFLAISCIIYLLFKQKKQGKERVDALAQAASSRNEIKDRDSQINELNTQANKLQAQVGRLEKFSQVADASDKAKSILQSANIARDQINAQAKKHYDELIAQGQSERDEVQRQARDRRARIEQLIVASRTIA